MRVRIRNKASCTPEQWARRMALDRKCRKRHKALVAAGLASKRECETVEYNAWRGMLKRCYLPSSRGYDRYGGRGIAVCKRWRDSYDNFLSDMGRRPDGFEMDRIDTNGNYTPKNCRWVAPVQNIRNRRCTWRVRFRGETRPLAEWAEITGFTYHLLQSRLYHGWSVKRALTVRDGRRAHDRLHHR